MKRKLKSSDASILFVLAANPTDAKLQELWAYLDEGFAKKIAKAIVDISQHYKDKDILITASSFLERTCNAPSRLKMSNGK